MSIIRKDTWETFLISTYHMKDMLILKVDSNKCKTYFEHKRLKNHGIVDWMNVDFSSIKHYENEGKTTEDSYGCGSMS